MGLVPSRESLYETPATASQPRALPFISRAAENYMYKTNRTERVFGTDMASGLAGGAVVPTALLNGMPTGELSHKIIEDDPNAVFIDGPAEATAAVVASRGGRRGSARNAEAPSPGRGTGTPPLETPAAEALRQGRTLYVYYYEHRVLPLTAEFFPSPDCVLFRQLWHARQQQNPRYHFQLDHTWSPGALTDPTAVYESFSELAAHNMTDIQAACLSAGQPVTKESLAQAQVQLQEAIRALNGCDVGMRCDAATSPESPRTRVPFATREEFYSLVVRTTKESMMYDTDAELRDAVCGFAAPGKAVSSNASEVGGELAAEGSSTAERARHRLRPVPCAIVLVRRCMPAHEYRYTYYIAHNERHHKASAGATGNSSRRRGPTNGCGTGEAQQQQRESHSTLVCGGSVRAAVDESYLVDRARQSKVGDDELTVPWVQVSVPQVPLGLAELRVVGMYGCWTVEEILRHTLFAPTVSVCGGLDGMAGAAASQRSPSREAQMEKVLRRAAPHSVPSSTLVNTAFFEKQVGDKEQCHTYFALCRLFAHGMRRCILGDKSDKAVATSTGVHTGSEHASTDSKLSGEHSQQTNEVAVERWREDPAWKAFMDVLSGNTSAASTLGDLANCFIIRFSNIPQLQLCRQIRCMLTELRDMYPTPPTLEDFQAAQRQRNVLAMSKKADARSGAGNDAAQGGMQGSSERSPLKGCNGDEDFTEQSNLQGIHRPLRTGNAGAPLSAASATDGHREPETTVAAKRDGKSAALPLSLDPEAIADRPYQVSERDRLEQVGFCCYVSYGVVVFRLSRATVARALHQLSFSPLHDSVEALCVTLTAAAPPPLTYRGELRPPARLRAHTMPAATPEACGAGEKVHGGDEGERGSTVASAETHSSETLENTYNNALRYSSSSATGFSMEPLWPMRRENASWATHAAALEDTPDELIGVLPRNSIERGRGRLLPLLGVVMPEGAATASNGSRNRGAAQQGRGSGTAARQQHHQQRQNNFSSSSTPSSALFQVDVYTVSAELDGMVFRELVELTHQEQQRGRESTACGASEEKAPCLLVGSVDAQGNVEPDSVLNWSPMAALGSLRWMQALAAAGCGNVGVSGDRDDAAAEMTAIQSLPQQSPSAPGSQGAVSVFVHEPERVLRAGDRVRFAPYCGGSPNLREDSCSRDVSASGTPNSRSHGGGNATPGAPRCGYWYVDDRLTTEDLVLSWMRRVGSRARETGGTDTKWVRFPEPVLKVLLRFAHTCRQQQGGAWLTMGHALHPLHSADEELVEPDLLQNYPDILRTRRFRQWRFSHDGYVYFHGVTVRIPGSAPLLSHPPPAAAMNAAVYHATIHNGGEAAAGMVGGRRPGMASVFNERFTSEPLQQYSPVMQYGEGPRSLPTMQHSSSGGVDGGQHGAGTSIGGPVYYANQAKCPIMGGNIDGSGGMTATHYDPSTAPQQLHPYPSTAPRQQRLSQRALQQYLPQPFPEEKRRGSGAPLHHAMQEQQMMLQPPQPLQQQDRGPGYSLARPYGGGSAGYNPHCAPTGRPSMGGGKEEEAIAAGCYGSFLPIAEGSADEAGCVTSNTANGLYFNGADLLQSNTAAATVGSSNHQPEHHPIRYRSQRVDGMSFSKGTPSGGAEIFADAADGVFLRTADRAYSNATVMGPAHVTSSFYGDICSPSAQQLPHTPQQHPQRFRSQTLSSSTASVLASGPTSGSWHTDSALLSYGPPPDVSGAVPPAREGPSPSQSASGCGKGQEETTRSPSAHSMMLAASGSQQHQYHLQQQHPPPMLPPPSVPAPPPQQPMSHSFHGEGDRVGHAAERRTTHDYPPRRSHHNSILAATSMTVPAAKPTLQKLSIHALRGTHSNGGHRAPPVASFAPDVVDPSPLSSGGSNTRSAIMTKDRTTENVDSGGDIASDSSKPIQAPRVLKAPAYHPDESGNTQHMRYGPQQVYWHSQQQHQEHPHQAHAPPPRSPQMASNSGSFRDTVTADVIEADSITVRVMQRKPSMARQSSYNGATGGVLAGGYRTGSGALGSSSNVAGGEGGGPDTSSPSPMGYGAMGVSPSGGLESMREESSSIHRKTGGVLASDRRATLEYRSYGTPQVVSPTAGQQLSSGRGTANAFAAPQSQRQSSTMGPSSPVQRTSQRTSHNPYTNARSLPATPLLGAAVCSAYSQGGADGGRVGSNGPNDFLGDALDNRYGSVSDFNAGASSPGSLGHIVNGMAHDTYHSRGGGDPAGLRSSPTTSQRPSCYPSQRAASCVGDFSRTDQLREGQHEPYASFYEAAGDVQTAGNYSDFYHSAAADGTTQGFFFSMGDYEESGNSAHELYGGTPHYQYHEGQGRPVQFQGHSDKTIGRGGSVHGSLPMPAHSMFHQQPQQRNVGGSNAYNGGVYEDGTPTYALACSPQLPPPPPHAYGPTPTVFQSDEVERFGS